MYCDRDWLRQGGSELDIPGDYQLIHEPVPTNVAKSLGIPALSTCLLSAETLGFERTGQFTVSNTSYTLTVVEPSRQVFGQRTPPLTELIKTILTRYPDGGQILKVNTFVSF